MKSKNPMVLVYGQGPEDTRCKTCVHLFTKKRSNTYYKCRFRKLTAGAETDHRVNWVSCGMYHEAIQCGVCGGHGYVTVEVEVVEDDRPWSGKRSRGCPQCQGNGLQPRKGGKTGDTARRIANEKERHCERREGEH